MNNLTEIFKQINKTDIKEDIEKIILKIENPLSININSLDDNTQYIIIIFIIDFINSKIKENILFRYESEN